MALGVVNARAPVGTRAQEASDGTTDQSQLRHTFATWCMQAGVDYVVIEKLLGHRLPGTGDLYVHDWDGRLREAVTWLEAFTEDKLRQETAAQVPLVVPPSYVEPSPSRVRVGNVVPRDRIELSTPAFSGLCSAN